MINTTIYFRSVEHSTAVLFADISVPVIPSVQPEVKTSGTSVLTFHVAALQTALQKSGITCQKTSRTTPSRATSSSSVSKLTSTDLPTLISHLAAPRARFLGHSMDIYGASPATYLLTYLLMAVAKPEALLCTWNEPREHSCFLDNCFIIFIIIISSLLIVLFGT